MGSVIEIVYKTFRLSYWRTLNKPVIALKNAAVIVTFAFPRIIDLFGFLNEMNGNVLTRKVALT